MGHTKNSLSLEDLFAAAYPLAQRAARVRSARFLGALRAGALDPSDLEQEIMLGLLSALLDFDDSRSSLATYVDLIAETKAKSVLRKTLAKKRHQSEAALNRTEPLHLLLAVELSLDVERALEKLPKKDRDVARFLVEHRPAEVARLLKVSRPAIYRSKDRVREILRKAGYRTLF